jgi:hypothetical protein
LAAVLILLKFEILLMMMPCGVCVRRKRKLADQKYKNAKQGMRRETARKRFYRLKNARHDKASKNQFVQKSSTYLKSNISQQGE